MDVAHIGGVALHHHLIDGGPMVVFANSLGSDFRIWNRVVDALPQDCGSLRYDKRGHGLSDLGEETFTMDAHIDDLEGLLDYLALGPVVLCGLSVGGMIAMGLAHRRPDLIAGLVLCDTGHKIGDAETWNARIDAVESGGIESISDAILERWFTRTFREDLGGAISVWRNMLIRTPAKGYARTCAAIRDTDLTSVASNLPMPTLCLVGEDDGSTPVALVEELAGLIPDARFSIINHAGHLPCIEQPEQVATLLGGFLRELHL